MTVMKKSNKEDAVSPVIGVMLMLVVTIVIAAVVAAFASGMGADVEATPTAVLGVDLKVTNSGNELKLQHISGDNLMHNAISVTVQDSDGNPVLTAAPSGSGFFKPGDLKTISLSGTKQNAGTYVKVIVLYEGKHVIVSKDVMVKS